MTSFDALLLQRKRGYFSGGFLSVEHATSLPQVLGFFLGSVLADAALICPAIALGLWISSRFDLRTGASRLLSLTLALFPLIAWDVGSYSLLEYLGDASNLSLMFELVDRRPSELFAVSASHLVTPLLILLAGGCAVLGLTWVLHQYAAQDPDRTESRPTARPPLALSVLAIVCGLVGTSMLRLQSDTLDYGLRQKPSAAALARFVALVTDLDRDGYGLLGAAADPDPRDGRVYPYAVDVPGNGLDEDGVAGDLPPGPAYFESMSAPAKWPARANVVLVVLESFRADTVGARLNGRSVTPVLDNLAAQGISSSNAYSLNGYTVQSRHHLFSGSLANLRGSTSLIDDFQANGYQVAYFSAQDESFGRADLRVGFEHADIAYDARSDRTLRYSTFATPGSLAVPFTVLQRRISQFLDRRPTAKPLFLYVNFHDTHFPYHHDTIRPLIDSTVLQRSEIQPGRASELRAMYLNTAANVDRAVGQLLQEIRESLGQEPAIIVTADHGESLFDEGFLGHGHGLNDAQTKIPFIVANLPLVVEEPFGQTDLRDALWSALAVGSEGRGLRPVLKDKPSGTVFQYLGTFERPRQIAFRTKRERTTFDFRTGRAQVGDRDWRRPQDLSPVGAQSVVALVRFWERARLAQHGALRGFLKND